MPKFVSNPSHIHLLEIKSWLREEYDEQGDGLWTNWIQIEKAFSNSQLFVILHDEQIVGFLTWDVINPSIYSIEITSVKFNFRNMGYGSFLYSQSEYELQKRGASIFTLFCSPIESESFWSKMNFNIRPYTGHTLPFKSMYKITNHSIQNISHELNNRFEIWEHQPNNKLEPYSTWTLPGKSEKSVKFISLCGANWYVRLIINGKIIVENKAKHFNYKGFQYLGSFVIFEY